MDFSLFFRSSVCADAAELISAYVRQDSGTKSRKSVRVFRGEMVPSALDGSRFESALGDFLGVVALDEHWRAEFCRFGLQPRRLF